MSEDKNILIVKEIPAETPQKSRQVLHVEPETRVKDERPTRQRLINCREPKSRSVII